MATATTTRGETMAVKRRCRLVAYYRVSTKRQGASGLGLEAQQAAIAAHVQATGCELVAEFVEVESGKRSDRPELAKALARAKRAGATLVIAKLDRLSRNVAFISALMDSGVEFVACDNPHMNRLTAHILAAVAEDEARRISERTRVALAAFKARGGRLGTDNLTDEARARGSAIGAQANRDQAAQSYADLLPMMLEWRAQGLSLGAIADRLNVEGHTTRTGANWSGTTVMRALNRAK